MDIIRQNDGISNNYIERHVYDNRLSSNDFLSKKEREYWNSKQIMTYSDENIIDVLYSYRLWITDE